MARLMVPLTQAVAKEPNKVKFKDYLRFHDAGAPDQKTKEMTPEAFAALYGARKKEA